MSCAPQVSIKLWELACEAYAEQLVDEGDFITGATYLVNINKIEEAIDLLVKHRFFREAMAIAKCRRGYSEELVSKITLAWAGCTIYEGSFDLAATLQMSMGLIEEAARTMARRNDHGSLFIASQLYKHAGKDDLCKSIGLLALKEVCLKQEHDKIELFLLDLPDLQWFRAISYCHGKFLKLLQQVTVMDGLSPSYCVEKIQIIKQEDPLVDGKAATDTAEVVEIEDNADLEVELPFLECVKEDWSTLGITHEEYPQLYETITNNLCTQQMPTSVKQLWFLVSVAVCELLMSSTKELWELHLTTALNYAMSWGKADQVFHLTRALLPRGMSDLTTLALMDKETEGADSKVICLLHLLYHTSEVCLLHSLLQNDEPWYYLINEFTQDKNESLVTERSSDNNSPASVSNYVEEDISSEPAKHSKDDVKEKESAAETDQEKQTVELAFTRYRKLKYFPTTATELLNVLHCHIDFFLKNDDVHGLMGKVSQSLSEPHKLLLELSLKLKEKGNLKDEDVRTLLSKVGSLKS